MLRLEYLSILCNLLLDHVTSVPKSTPSIKDDTLAENIVRACLQYCSFVLLLLFFLLQPFYLAVNKKPPLDPLSGKLSLYS
jgi:hypothetical protein